MFLDGDDYLDREACNKLYSLIKQRNVDVIQFGTVLEYEDNVSSDLVNWVENFMRPSEEVVEQGNLLNACYNSKKLNCNLVNKIWNTKCCKRAYQYVNDEHLVSGEDRYASFILFYFANGESGTLEKYYHYHLGIGVTGSNILDIKRFEKRCQGAKVCDYIKLFLQQIESEEKYKNIFVEFCNEILWDCVDCWFNKLNASDYKEGYNILLKYWTPDIITGALGRTFFEKQDIIVERIDKQSKSNIALYYRFIGFPEMDEVIERYAGYYKKTAGSIYLITDSDAPSQENQYMGYELLHVFAATEANWDKYFIRSSEIYKILKEKEIAEVCYISPTSHVLELDKVLIESANISFRVVYDEYQLDKYLQLQKLKNAQIEQLIEADNVVSTSLQNKVKNLEEKNQKYEHSFLYRIVGKLKK